MYEHSLVLVLDNIRSTLNVGAILRTADAVLVDRVYLCGITATPKHPKVTKTSLGAEKYIDWKYQKSTFSLLKKLKDEGYQIIGLEINSEAVNYWKTNYSNQVALVIGNEITGIDKKILNYCNQIVQIPMFGKKESLNVATATGIAVYEIVRQWNIATEKDK